ncbi:MAG TPA: hypothetical protein VF187_10505, partial [Gemmatimonadales bacterium]
MLRGLLLSWAGLAAVAPPAAAAGAPLAIVIQSARGESRVPVRFDPSGGPVVPAPALLPALGGRSTLGEGWADVMIGPRTFRFLLGAPLYSLDGKVRPLAG